MESKKDVYVISLDAVDINLLPTSYNHSHEKVVPLWTKSNLDLRNNDYYEFVIKTNEHSQPTDKKNIVIEFITCHICDMDVPKVYMNEHRKSFKHKFNKKIADVALKRLQLYMSRHENTDSINNERNPSTYYCLECSMIVDREDEISHKNSVPHKNSVIFERFLNDFLHLYTNDDKLDVTDTQDMKTEVGTDNEIKVGATNDISKTKAKQLGNREIKNVPAVTKADKIKCSINLNDYLMVFNNKFDTKPMVFKANGDYVEIRAIDGSVVRVCEESFHALKKLGKKFVQCMLCKYIFDLTSSDEHLLSDGHMKMLSLPLKDKHCVRQISESWSHCLICNTIIERADLHASCNIEHNNNLKLLLISDKLNETDDKCNKNADFHVKDKIIETKLFYNDVLKGNTQNISKADDLISPYVETNVSTDDTKSSNSPSNEIHGKRFCHDCNVSISIKKIKKHENTMKHILNTMSDKHYLLRVLDANRLQCKICEVHVKNNFDDIEKHFSASNHVDNYNKLLSINNITKRDKITYYCSICHVYILFKNEYLHVDSKEHKLKSNIDVKPKSETAGIVKPEANICNTVEPAANISANVEPKKIVTETVEPVKNSMNESGETSRTVEPDTKCEVKTEPKEETDPNYHFCVTCQVKVPNNCNNIKMHNEGRPHMKNLEILESDVKKKQETINKDSDAIHYLLAETKTIGVLMCKICKVELSKSDTNIKTHIEGANHMLKYETFLNDNRLIVVADNIYCAVCFDLVANQSEMSHCSSKKHILNLMA